MNSIGTRKIHLNINWVILRFSGSINCDYGSVYRPRNWHYGREILYQNSLYNCTNSYKLYVITLILIWLYIILICLIIIKGTGNVMEGKCYISKSKLNRISTKVLILFFAIICNKLDKTFWLTFCLLQVEYNKLWNIV